MMTRHGREEMSAGGSDLAVSWQPAEPMEGVLWSLHRAVQIWRPMPWDLLFVRVGHALPGMLHVGHSIMPDRLTVQS